MAYFEPEIGRISKSKRRSRKEENMRNVFKPKVGNRAMLRLLWKTKLPKVMSGLNSTKLTKLMPGWNCWEYKVGQRFKFSKVDQCQLASPASSPSQKQSCPFQPHQLSSNRILFCIFQMLPFSATPAFFLKKSFPYFCATGVTYQQPADAFLAKLIR